MRIRVWIGGALGALMVGLALGPECKMPPIPSSCEIDPELQGLRDAGALCESVATPDEDPCGPLPDPASPPCEEDQYPDLPTQWIGYDTSPMGPFCVTGIPNWTRESLFIQLAKAPGGGGGSLARYCLYRWSGNDPTTLSADISALKMAFPGSVSEDRRAISPQMDFNDWAGVNFELGVDWGPTMSPTHPVRLVLVDNLSFFSPTPLPGSGDNFHGEVLYRVAAQQLCPTMDTPCSRLRASMAIRRRRIPLLNQEMEVANHGEYGRFSDLVRALEVEVMLRIAELIDNSPEPASRLVLALPLGYQPAPCAPNKACLQQEPGHDAVLKALQAASCIGAAIFAAAGNHTSTSETGLMYPAAWQDQPAPTPEECLALFLEGADAGAGLYNDIAVAYQNSWSLPLRPQRADGSFGHLLNAVGGLEHTGKPLLTAREGACPRYAALGLGLWNGDMPSGAHLLTGSSVATLVSGVRMARDWSLSPEKHPEDILDDDKNSTRITFSPQFPCVKWRCPTDGTRWVAMPNSYPISSQNPLPFLTMAHPTPAITAHLCPDTRLPAHCQRPTGMPFEESFPQPNGNPCVVKCVVLTDQQPNSSTLVVDPATDLIEARLIVWEGVTRKIIGIGSLSAEEQFKHVDYDIGPSARVMLEGLDSSGNYVRSQQILIADPSQ